MGIGEAIATALAAKGANLVLLSRSEVSPQREKAKYTRKHRLHISPLTTYKGETQGCCE